METVDARYIVLSYNTGGIIPFDELVELFSAELNDCPAAQRLLDARPLKLGMSR